MIDFFDEDFPLTKKQEKALLAAKNKQNAPDIPEADEIRLIEAVNADSSADDNVCKTNASSDATDAEASAKENDSTSAQPTPETAIETAAADEDALPQEPKEVHEAVINEEAAKADVESQSDTIEPCADPVPETVTAADVSDDDVDLIIETASGDNSIKESGNDPEHIIDSTEVLLQLGASGESRDNAAVNSHEAISSKQKSLDDIDAALHAELKSLVEKLDDMERFVDTMDFAKDDSSDTDGADFSYEYDDRYFAEEETPAYKYPELYKKTERTKPIRRKESENDNINISIDKKTLFKVGAIVAATAAAVKLLSGKDE